MTRKLRFPFDTDTPDLGWWQAATGTDSDGIYVTRWGLL